jgi:hypothetical protein
MNYTPPSRYYMSADCSPELGSSKFLWSLRVIDENHPRKLAVVWRTGRANSHLEAMGHIVVALEEWYRRTYPTTESATTPNNEVTPPC